MEEIGEKGEKGRKQRVRVATRSKNNRSWPAIVLGRLRLVVRERTTERPAGGV